MAKFITHYGKKEVPHKSRHAAVNTALALAKKNKLVWIEVRRCTNK